MTDAMLHQVSRNARAQDFDSDHRRAQDKEQQMRDHKDNQDEPATRKTAGGTKSGRK